jgi:hypothetical protein
VFEDVSALVTVAVIVSHECWDRMVVRNVWRFVSATTSKVHATDPEVVGSPSRSMVSVPVHVPARNDCGGDGVVGAEPPSHPQTATRDTQ